MVAVREKESSIAPDDPGAMTHLTQGASLRRAMDPCVKHHVGLR